MDWFDGVLYTFDHVIIYALAVSLYIAIDFDQRRRRCYRQTIRLGLFSLRHVYPIVVSMLFVACIFALGYSGRGIRCEDAMESRYCVFYVICLSIGLSAGMTTIVWSCTVELMEDKLWAFRRSARHLSIRFNTSDILNLWRLCHRAERVPRSVYTHIALCDFQPYAMQTIQ